MEFYRLGVNIIICFSNNNNYNNYYYDAEELTQKSGNGGYEVLPSKYFEPLQWACESKIPRLMDIAIDALHYMMGNSFLFMYINA